MEVKASYHRALDANINRLKEGIRVVEDLFRYVLEDREISSTLKELRHSVKPHFYTTAIIYRDSINDVLKTSNKSELERDNLKDIVISNFKRAQEASRVLEELCKLDYAEYSPLFKNIRYRLYSLEKEALSKHLLSVNS